MKKFVNFIDSLPFAGKMTLKPALFEVYQSKDLKSRLKAYAWLVVVMVLFWVGHGIQAIEGFQVVIYDSLLMDKIVGLVYALTNMGVVLTHVYWFGRTTIFLF